MDLSSISKTLDTIVERQERELSFISQMVVIQENLHELLKVITEVGKNNYELIKVSLSEHAAIMDRLKAMEEKAIISPIIIVPNKDLDAETMERIKSRMKDDIQSFKPIIVHNDAEFLPPDAMAGMPVDSPCVEGIIKDMDITASFNPAPNDIIASFNHAPIDIIATPAFEFTEHFAWQKLNTHNISGVSVKFLPGMIMDVKLAEKTIESIKQIHKDIADTVAKGHKENLVVGYEAGTTIMDDPLSIKNEGITQDEASEIANPCSRPAIEEDEK